MGIVRPRCAEYVGSGRKRIRAAVGEKSGVPISSQLGAPRVAVGPHRRNQYHMVSFDWPRCAEYVGSGRKRIRATLVEKSGSPISSQLGAPQVAVGPHRRNQYLWVPFDSPRCAEYVGSGLAYPFNGGREIGEAYFITAGAPRVAVGPHRRNNTLWYRSTRRVALSMLEVVGSVAVQWWARNRGAYFITTGARVAVGPHRRNQYLMVPFDSPRCAEYVGSGHKRIRATVGEKSGVYFITTGARVAVGPHRRNQYHMGIVRLAALR